MANSVQPPRTTESIISETLVVGTKCFMKGYLVHFLLGGNKGIEDIVRRQFSYVRVSALPSFFEERGMTSLIVPTIKTSQGDIIAPLNLVVGGTLVLDSLGDAIKVTTNVATLAFRSFEAFIGMFG